MSLLNQVINRPVIEDLPYVEAVLNYLIPMAEKPVNYTFDPPPGIPRQSGSYQGYKLPIRDGRSIAPNLSLDREGFALVTHHSKVRDFYDENEIYNVYYPEALLKLRFSVVNVWRPIAQPVEESPLAVCDAQSIAPSDLVAGDLVYRDRVGETYAVTYNQAHRWFYFPHQRYAYGTLRERTKHYLSNALILHKMVKLDLPPTQPLTIPPVHQMRPLVKASNCEH
ncbi:CmcJ/NvfI family oxidoreductase [Aerosakkonemataceae cyanobacterium BLCC-F50]|uniref:CmcJ/NvfI family oxidoreductase n=1 Tax=Floridaenema flaviceps BLCC-F50 TaxID=3153642 RepID=A0ABV4XMG6_9CYAN